MPHTVPPLGKHLLVDLWGADNLTDINDIEKALVSSAEVCGATVLGTKFHEFGSTGGVTGIAILAESHISIHTWPEDKYAAIDIFMCGKCDPEKAIDSLKDFFKPDDVSIERHKRGNRKAIS